MAEVSTALLQQSLAMGRANPKPPAKALPPKPVVKKEIPNITSVIAHVGIGGHGQCIAVPVRRVVRPDGEKPYELVLNHGDMMLVSPIEREAFSSMIEGGTIREVQLGSDRKGNIVRLLN